MSAAMTRRRQGGLTLIELMVALVLGMLVAAAAVAALIVARQGFNNVDSNTQLRENSRFAASIIQRVVVQAGFENAAYGFVSAAKPPGLRGWDNALLNTGTLPATQVDDGRPAGCAVTDTSCRNGSDILMVRYMGASLGGTPLVGDGTMINCAGGAEPVGPIPTRPEPERALSVFSVVRSAAGEPTLACTYFNIATAAWQTVPLVAGVEGFQVLYGVDTVGNDTVADLYLRAADVQAAAAWARVRSLRIGLLIRGPVGSAVDRAASAETIPVLGPGFIDAADVGSGLAVVADGRLRQRSVFTVHLRNAQVSP